MNNTHIGAATSSKLLSDVPRYCVFRRRALQFAQYDDVTDGAVCRAAWDHAYADLFLLRRSLTYATVTQSPDNVQQSSSARILTTCAQV